MDRRRLPGDENLLDAAYPSRFEPTYRRVAEEEERLIHMPVEIDFLDLSRSFAPYTAETCMIYIEDACIAHNGNVQASKENMNIVGI
jgi:hypothetical protein